MSYYPETFDTTGPESLEGSYTYLSWAAVSIQRALADQPETSWELLPGLLGQAWGDPDWYQRNEWLADFYNTLYHYASSVEPVLFFTVDELGEPGTELARVIDSVVQSWNAAAYAAEVESTYDENGQWSAYAHDADGSGQPDGADAYHPTSGYEYEYGYEATGEHPTDAGSEPDREPLTVDGPEREHPAVDGRAQDPLADLDPEVARRALARVADEETDDLSTEELQILATVLTVERFQYLAREFELI